MRRTLITLSLLALLFTANAQTMFRDVTYQDTCETVLEKLEAHPDITITPFPLRIEEELRSGFTEWCDLDRVAATVDSLFGAKDVVLIWESGSLTISTTGFDAVRMVENAVEGFTQAKGQPYYLNEPTPFGETFVRNCQAISCYEILKVDVALWDTIQIYTSYSVDRMAHIGGPMIDSSNFYYEAVIYVAQGQGYEDVDANEDANQF